MIYSKRVNEYKTVKEIINMKKLLTFFLIAVILAAFVTVSASATSSTVESTPVSTVTESAPSADASDSTEAKPTEASAFEKVFQVIFIVIMTVGIVGLPAYYWLNSRRKKALEEYNENQNNGENE
jgi:beta-lactamase regulating signal transducer with metallopeptidase domain